MTDLVAAPDKPVPPRRARAMRRQRLDDPTAPRGFLASRTAPLVYINVPKSGCTTIKNILHRIDSGAFLSDPLTIHARRDLLVRRGADIAPRLKSDLVFTFVRHPLQRAYSCFNEKIYYVTKYSFPAIRDCIERSYGADFSGEASPDRHRENFKKFLRFAEDSFNGANGWRRDPHWCPQSMILEVTGRWRMPDVIGRIERFDASMGAVMALGGAPYDFVTPRMNEGAPPPFHYEDILDDEVRAIGARLYEADFRNFGYLP